MRLCGDDESDDEIFLENHVRHNVELSSTLREKGRRTKLVAMFGLLHVRSHRKLIAPQPYNHEANIPKHAAVSDCLGV